MMDKNLPTGQCETMEARAGVEPTYTDLQSGKRTRQTTVARQEITEQSARPASFALKWAGIYPLIALALTACGGGGSTDPHPTAIGTACTLIQPVRINLYGDSTQFGLDSFTHVQAVPSPSADLQADMDARFGPGAVEVTNYGVSGTTAAAFVRRPADIEVVNYGINDQDYTAGESIDEYEALLRKIASGSPQMVFETPNATPGDNPRFAVYVQRMRDVAASLALPLADVNAYVQTVPAWQTYFADFAHPNAAMYGLIVRNSLAPTLAPLVGALRCE